MNRRYANVDDEFWSPIIYTEEAHFYIGYSDPKKIYRKRIDDFSDPKFMEKIKPTEAQSVYIWNSLVYGVSQASYLLMVGLMVNYTEVLKEGLIPFIEMHHILSDIL